MEDLPSKIEFPSKHNVFRVKKAIELATGREVAIKILRFDQENNEESGSSRRGEILESFFQEVSILSNCNHPNIVQIL
jgi:serine/threonine protein kinase